MAPDTRDLEQLGMTLSLWCLVGGTLKGMCPFQSDSLCVSGWAALFNRVFCHMLYDPNGPAYDPSINQVMRFIPRMRYDQEEGARSERTGMCPIIGTPVDSGRGVFSSTLIFMGIS